MRSILIVGAGQSGLQLGLSLLDRGYQVTLVSARTPDEIRNGRVMSTQAMFHNALQAERAYGLNLWDDHTPRIGALDVALPAPSGGRALEFLAPLDDPAQSVDQRLKMAAWLELLEERGGTVEYRPVGVAELDGLTQDGRYELVVVAAGRGELVGAFERDASRSPHQTPQRGLAASYLHGVAPDARYPAPAIGFNVVPGLGELFVIPALTLSGRCDILFWESVPDGPLDLWRDPMDPADHLKLTLDLARQYVPWVYERCAAVELTDSFATLAGRFTPTVRRPVAVLPSGGQAIGMGDVVVTNDPITGQGSNTAAKAAAHYLAAILERDERPFDRAWMEQTFESFWTGTASTVTDWTNAMLGPLPEHVQRILGTCAGIPAVARRFGNAFADPNDLRDWFLDPVKADAYLGSV